MHLSIKATIVAASLLIASAGAALAYPGISIRMVDVYAGPGSQFRVVDRLHAGERLNIQQCRHGFCFITHRGPDGWVSARVLARYVPNPTPPPPIYRPFPSYGWGWHSHWHHGHYWHY